jgi:hypothetical protein
MEEILGLLFRLLLFIVEFLLNIFSGMAINIILRAPGVFLYKIIWPPNWFKEIDYDDDVTIYVFGVIFYIIIAVLAYFYCCNKPEASW